MSSSMALRRSPKPGALTAATLRPPRSLLTTSVASASPSTSSAMISSGLPALHHRLEQRQHRLQAGQLLLVDQDVGALELRDHLLGVGDEVRRDVAAVELHAFDDVELGLEALGLLDRDDALVADFLHRLGDHLADLGVAIGRDRADLGDLVVGGDLLRLGLELVDDRLRRRCRCRASGPSDWRRRRPTWRLRARSPGREPSLSWCRRRRRRWSWTRPRAPSARPCSRTCRRARSPWRR